MSFVKKERWTEEQVVNLPAGEHDYFDRKSGRLFDPKADSNKLYDSLAKEACAFANSGGGHLILGVCDDGTIDGVPPFFGKTKTREWLEQKLPDLLDYRLVDFRVHTVTPADNSAIPAGREIIVVDVGDSALAPHQSRKHTQYFHRSGSHSIAAPHFYLELLRQRVTNASLDFSLSKVKPDHAWLQDGFVTLRLDADFLIENIGRIAAYKWSLVLEQYTAPPERAEDFMFGYIPGSPGRASSMRVDDTILPSCRLNETRTFGVRLRPLSSNDEQGFKNDLTEMLSGLSLTFRVATETSPGERKTVDLGPAISTEETLALLKEKKLVAA